jgi:Domain of unknown function (DUF4258)
LADAPLPLVYRVHALQRMVERDIREEDVAHVVLTGRTIEDYPDDKPYPSRLILGWIGSRPIHVVAATSEHEIIIITVYEPDAAQWQPGFEKRKP